MYELLPLPRPALLLLLLLPPPAPPPKASRSPLKEVNAVGVELPVREKSKLEA